MEEKEEHTGKWVSTLKPEVKGEADWSVWKKEKREKMMKEEKIRIAVAAALVCIVLIGAAWYFVGRGEGGGDTGTGGGTGTGKAANWGDYVDVDYTLYDEGGKVIDTSLASVALNASMYDKARVYKPLSVALKQNNGYIAGFTAALVGMREGESRRVEIPAKDAYGELNPELIKEMPRFYSISRFEQQPLDYLEERGFNVTLNRTLTHKFWFVRVMNISEEGIVTLRHEPSLGQEIEVQGMGQRVVNITDDQLFFMLLPALNATYTFTDPQTGETAQAKVVGINETSVLLDYNHPLAGKKLIFDLKVVKVS